MGYFARHLDPRRPAWAATPAQLVGTLAHCALLDPAEFEKRYAVGPDVNRATKESKQFAERQAILLGVKTCGDASPEDCKRQLARMRYHVQSAFYVDGYEAASGGEVLGLVFVTVEADLPHAASAVMLDDLGIEQGRRDYRRNFNRYAECRKTNVKPGHSDSID